MAEADQAFAPQFHQIVGGQASRVARCFGGLSLMHLGRELSSCSDSGGCG